MKLIINDEFVLRLEAGYKKARALGRGYGKSFVFSTSQTFGISKPTVYRAINKLRRIKAKIYRYNRSKSLKT